MVGFGATRYMAEYSIKRETGKRGTQLFEAQLPSGDGTYRVLRFPWSATPNTLPALAAVRESPSAVNVYASWNGATAVANGRFWPAKTRARWRPSPGHLERLRDRDQRPGLRKHVRGPGTGRQGPGPCHLRTDHRLLDLTRSVRRTFDRVPAVGCTQRLPGARTTPQSPRRRRSRPGAIRRRVPHPVPPRAVALPSAAGGLRRHAARGTASGSLRRAAGADRATAPRCRRPAQWRTRLSALA